MTESRAVTNLTTEADSTGDPSRLAVLGAMKRRAESNGRGLSAPTFPGGALVALGAILTGLLLSPGGALAASSLTLPNPDDSGSSGDESLFTRIGDFASDNATWFIIGLVALAVILAAIFILRAGRKDKAQPSATARPTAQGSVPPGPGSPEGATGKAASAGTVSAAEMKRRRRAAMQRAREEERLRRKGASPRVPASQPPLDPVEAEKAAARGQAGPAVPPGAEPPVPPVSPEAPTAVTPPVPAGAVGAVAAGAAAGAVAGRVESGDAEQRLREKVEQIKAGQAETPAAQPPVESPPVAPPSGTPAGTPRLSEAAPDLADAERRLQADREAREQTLGQAEARLRDLEARAEAAERRAAFAEQLASLKAEEGEHERRLDEIVARIDQAEQRARLAEIRAEEAERTASEALRGGGAISPAAPSPPAAAPMPPVAASSSPDPRPAAAPPPVPPAGGAIDINAAGFEELRSVGLSVTQATRVMAYRERFGGYGSVEDLARVPGFTPDVIEALRGQITT